MSGSPTTNWARSRLKKAKGCFAGMQERFAEALSFGVVLRQDKPLIVAATNRQPKRALKAYKKRWQIECLFAETKTRGFNMEDTRLTQPAKLSLLLAVIGLALAPSLACAIALKGHSDITRASHGYRRKSWFRTGFDVLRHWLFANPASALNRWNTIWSRVPNRFYKTRVV
ncbi:transposase [Mesorhizobium sp. L103C119B0]|uniref:transposase n=1 Tax=Mesorhizobium sp. L103C119B0 TaxID=1287085 RepID=UPI0018CBE4E4|nr:transposase [Mesorhizobium sp. L103C119B0]